MENEIHMYSWILIVDSSSKHSFGHVERLSSELFRSSCNDCFDFILFHFLCPPWGELLINQGNKLKDERANSRELLIAWALGFELEEQLVPHRGLGAAHKPPACPQRYTSSLLLGYLGQMCSHIQGAFMLGVNISKIVEAQYSTARLKFPKHPALFNRIVTWTVFAMDWGDSPFKRIHVSPARSREITFKWSFCKTLHFQLLRV